jgi:hypothetical protein
LKEITPQRKKTIISSGLKHPFWTKILKPYLEQEAAENHAALRTCNKEDIEVVRLSIDYLEALMAYPQEQLDMALTDIELERRSGGNDNEQD